MAVILIFILVVFEMKEGRALTVGKSRRLCWALYIYYVQGVSKKGE